MTDKIHRTDWLMQARWGVMTHYLAEAIDETTGIQLTPEKWNELVDGFDVEGLVKQLDSIRPGFYMITLGQNTGFYCTPNATYDQYVGIHPSKCSRRDIVADLFEVLEPRGIPLMIYFPSSAPCFDQTAMDKLEWRDGDFRNAEFQRKWEEILREDSERWGKHVKGWWFDGCYYGDAMYFQPDEPNLHSFARAARAGNPDAVVAFNPGVMIKAYGAEEDYTAGETNEPETVECRGRWLDGEQWHMMTYLGRTWGRQPLRFTSGQVAGITRNAVADGGVVTYDVPLRPNGLIHAEFIDALSTLNDDPAQPWREKISIAVTSQPTISEAGASKPGRARFRVKNVSDGHLTGSLAPRSLPAGTAHFGYIA